MSHPVYLVATIGAPRNHHALFVETDSVTGRGVVFQVTGNIQNGMQFETENRQCPEQSIGFVKKSHLGHVAADSLHLVEDTCRANPAPKRQFDGPKRLYPDEPLRRCQEWTKETVDSLISRRILQAESHLDTSSAANIP